ncbi:MAG: thioredoxin family protein [Bacteroidales bacterium]|nr:thioredoxin family protein [Bacteroidales bacterium]
MKNTLLTLLSLLMLGYSALAGEGVKVGDKAPSFRLQNVDGRMVSLSDYDEKTGVILIFTCNHCPYSVAYEDRIIALDKKFATQGFPVIAINPNDPSVQPEDSYENMILRSQEKDFPFPYLFDKGQEVYPEYGATRTPHVFLLENRGSDFEVVYIGAIDDNYQNEEYVEEKYLENAIADIQAGRKVGNDFTKAIGCTIKKQK